MGCCQLYADSKLDDQPHRLPRHVQIHGQQGGRPLLRRGRYRPFSVDGQLQFFGWVFTKSKDRWGVIDVVCYDRLRYFKNSASYAFYDMTAGDILKQMAADMR